jgi:hypothetical protein
MTELQKMQNRIGQLEQDTQNRIAQLEQENLILKSKGKAQALRQRFILGLAVIGVGLALATHKGNTDTESGVIVCRQLKVIDANRNVMVTLGSTKDGEGHIALYGAAKQIIGLSATTDTGDGTIWVNSADGVPMARVSSKDGKGVLWAR